MPDIVRFFSRVPVRPFTGTVFRAVSNEHASQPLSMRGSVLFGGRYNLEGYFGSLYASLDKATPAAEIMRASGRVLDNPYLLASLRVRFSRTVDLTNPMTLRLGHITAESLISNSYVATVELGLRAWEAGIEALLVPSAALPGAVNLVAFLDNQKPKWLVELEALDKLALP